MTPRRRREDKGNGTGKIQITLTGENFDNLSIYKKPIKRLIVNEAIESFFARGNAHGRSFLNSLEKLGTTRTGRVRGAKQ